MDQPHHVYTHAVHSILQNGNLLVLQQCLHAAYCHHSTNWHLLSLDKSLSPPSYYCCCVRRSDPRQSHGQGLPKKSPNPYTANGHHLPWEGYISNMFHVGCATCLVQSGSICLFQDNEVLTRCRATWQPYPPWPGWQQSPPVASPTHYRGAVLPECSMCCDSLQCLQAIEAEADANSAFKEAYSNTFHGDSSASLPQAASK